MPDRGHEETVALDTLGTPKKGELDRHLEQRTIAGEFKTLKKQTVSPKNIREGLLNFIRGYMSPEAKKVTDWKSKRP